MLKTSLTFIKNQQQLSNLVIYGIGQAFNLITPILVIPYIVSICSEEGYGKIGVGMALSFFLMVFVDYGSDIVSVKEVAINRDNQCALEKTFITTYSAKFILLVLVLVTASLIFYFVPYFNDEKPLFFFGLAMIIGQFINPTWFFQGIENFKWITVVNIVSKIIYVVGVFIFIKEPGDYVYNNLIWGIGMIVPNGIAFGYIMLKHSFSFTKVVKEDIVSLIKGSFKMFLSQIFTSLQMYSPIVLISFFGNNSLAGQYKIVDQIIIIFKTYILLFFSYVYPRVCYLLEKNVKKGLRFWKIYNGLNFLFILCTMIVISVFSQEIVSYFNPKEIIEISDLLKIAVLIPLLQSITIPLKQLVLGWNNEKAYVRLTMTMTMISLISIIVVAPLFKVMGVLLSLILTEILLALFFFQMIKKKLFLRSI
jgi:O-antigen/teichoic acid export membrane protein